MMMQPFLILFVLFLLLSILLLILLVKQRSGLAFISAQGHLDTAKVAQLEAEIKELEGGKYSLQTELKQTEIQLVQAQTRLEGLVKQDDFLQQSEKSFENLAQKILDAQSKKLKEESKETLTPLLNPLKENLASFSKRMETINASNIEGQTKLSEQLKSLKEQSLKISDDANNLTKALKGDNKAQGDWGEMVLEELLESSGLRKGEEYITQKAQEGGQKPDVIVKLPENRHIIVDSKVSLLAWSNYTEAESSEQKEVAMKAHKASLRTHYKNLSSKEYEKIENLNTPDFILMFVPIEGALLAALKEDNKMFLEAYGKNIILVSPSTLLVTLRTIHNIWRYENQNKNAKEIADQAEGMLKKFQSFTKDLDDVGKSLDKAKENYNDAVKKLSTGNNNVIRQAQKLQDKGIKMEKQFPKRFNSELLEEEEE